MHNIKESNLMKRPGLRADKIPTECQIADCHYRVTYLLTDYNDPKFYPRGVCTEHAHEYRIAHQKRETKERTKAKGKRELPKDAVCALCEEPQFMNEYNLATCVNGHINAQTVVLNKRKGPKPN